ncbi:MAG: glycosyltransferase family 4 protein [Polyangiales bacterium]
MRIALIDPSLFTWPYDAALALALADAGHVVRIVGKPPRAADTGPALELLDPHFYRRLASPAAEKLPRAAFLGIKGFSHAAGMVRLLASLNEFRPDVIHFQWAPLPAVDRLFIPALRRIAPVVLTVHDSAPFNGAPRSALQLAGATAIFHSFDRLIVHTEAAAERVRGYGLPAEKVRRIAHGPLDGSSVVVPKRVRKPNDPVTVLLFGRIKPYKGADVLLKAAAAMAPEARRKLRIHIVGQPFMDLAPLYTIVNDAKLGDHVRIEPRFVADHEVGELLGSADVVALPYREIDASGVLMTAISAGVPIVATRVGLFAELLEDGVHGRVIGVNDHVALAHALEALVTQPELRAQMSARVRALRDSLPTWASIAQQTASLYGELLPTARKDAEREVVRFEGRT